MFDIRPYGDRAVLVEVGDLAAAMAVAARVRAAALSGVTDVVAGPTTVLVHLEGRPPPELEDVLTAPLPTTSLAGPIEGPLRGDVTSISVRYDGPDLGEIARSTGMTVAEVVTLHTSVTYTVGFCGFAPGFAYLTGLSAELVVPRRATPRQRVPAGSVAIADVYTAVYPSASPGGWHLLGATDAILFDPRRSPPALVEPGDVVRFEAV